MLGRIEPALLTPLRTAVARRSVLSSSPPVTLAIGSGHLTSLSAPWTATVASRRCFANSTCLHSDDRHTPSRSSSSTHPSPSSSQLNSTSPSSTDTSKLPKSAADYLLSQAALEEEADFLAAQQRKPVPAELREEAWDGDEPQYRAIRRILEDQYQPLRIKGFKKEIPTPAPLPNYLFDPDRPSPTPPPTPSTPLEPWQVKFRAPAGHSPPSEKSTTTSTAVPLPSSRRVSPRKRLADAYERTLDYRAGYGLHHGAEGARIMVPDEEGGSQDDGSAGGSPSEKRRAMGGMRAWEGIVEDKIQQAQRDGLFKKLKGRGKPMQRNVEEESNPFIPRDDFLINRVVRAQGVAPPWIEMQQELETSLTAFRNSIRESWFRRATRMQSLGGVSWSGIKEVERGWRDVEWEEKERSYHETSARTINAIVRRYNVIAPYAVRRQLISPTAEVEVAMTKMRPFIVEELTRRFEGKRSSEWVDGKKVLLEPKMEDEVIVEQKAVEERMWPAFRRAVRELLG